EREHDADGAARAAALDDHDAGGHDDRRRERARGDAPGAQRGGRGEHDGRGPDDGPDERRVGARGALDDEDAEADEARRREGGEPQQRARRRHDPGRAPHGEDGEQHERGDGVAHGLTAEHGEAGERGRRDERGADDRHGGRAAQVAGPGGERPGGEGAGGSGGHPSTVGACWTTVQSQVVPGSLGQMTTRLEPDALLLVLGPRPGRDVGRWLGDGLRAAVVDGRLEAGTVLPSGRDAAAALGVSRGTVTAAVDVLVGEGLLVSRPRSGVVVASLPAPDRAARAATRAEPAPGGGAPRGVSVGTPDPALFPRAAWARAVRDGVRGLADADLGYPDPQGLPALREALAVHLRRARGAHVTASDVVVVSGVAQGLALLARLLATGRVAPSPGVRGGPAPGDPVRV